VDQLRTLALQEEDNYTRTVAFVDSVRQDILNSQGFLTKWQLVLLSQAQESLDRGNHMSAMEWAEQARDLPREPKTEEVDPMLNGSLWMASLALLGAVIILIPIRALRRPRSAIMMHLRKGLGDACRPLFFALWTVLFRSRQKSSEDRTAPRSLQRIRLSLIFEDSPRQAPAEVRENGA